MPQSFPITVPRFSLCRLAFSLWLLAAASQAAHAQPFEFQWARSSSGSGQVNGYNLLVDAFGHSYLNAGLLGTVSFGPFTLTEGPGAQTFIAKYGTTGDVLWAQAFPVIGYLSAADAGGNVYWIGKFSDPVSVGSFPLTSAGDDDVLVAKLNGSGTVLWAHSFGGISKDSFGGIAVDGVGNLWVTGTFIGNATFGSFNLTSPMRDTFLIRLDSAGTVQSAQSFLTESQVQSGLAPHVRVDATGSVYVFGAFSSSTTNIGPFSLHHNSTVLFSMFVAKFDGAGTVLWAASGGPGLVCGGFLGTYPLDLAIDSNGNANVVGYLCDGPNTFGPFTIAPEVGGGGETFVVKYSPLGSVVSARATGSGHSVYSVDTDSMGNKYFTGRFSGSVAFGATTLTSVAGSLDGFIAAYDASDAAIWAKSCGGTGSDGALEGQLDAAGNIYFGGNYNGSASFGAHSLTTADPFGEVYVTKLSSPSAACPSDSDGDGVQDSIDPLPNFYSPTILDTGTPPVLNASIATRGNQILCVSDLMAPRGVKACSLGASGGSLPASILFLCPADGLRRKSIGTGACVEISCGNSITAFAADGNAALELLLPNSYLAGTVVLPEGNELTFRGDTLEAIAPATNNTALTIVDALGSPQALIPGDTIILAAPIAPAAPVPGDDVCVGGTAAGQQCGQNADCPGGLCGLKNRFVSFVPLGGASLGIKTTLIALDANSVATPGNYNGTTRWVGPPTVNINDGISGVFNAAPLQCAFHSQDWSDAGMLHVYGSVVVPGSSYDVQMCAAEAGPCSAPLRINTAKFGDVVTPVNTVNFQDVNSIVAKFQGAPTGPSKTRTKLTNSIVNPANPINFQEVSACVSAFQSKPFKQVVTTPPATCP